MGCLVFIHTLRTYTISSVTKFSVSNASSVGHPERGRRDRNLQWGGAYPSDGTRYAGNNNLSLSLLLYMHICYASKLRN